MFYGDIISVMLLRISFNVSIFELVFSFLVRGGKGVGLRCYVECRGVVFINVIGSLYTVSNFYGIVLFRFVFLS